MFFSSDDESANSDSESASDDESTQPGQLSGGPTTNWSQNLNSRKQAWERPLDTSSSPSSSSDEEDPEITKFLREKKKEAALQSQSKQKPVSPTKTDEENSSNIVTNATPTSSTSTAPERDEQHVCDHSTLVVRGHCTNCGGIVHNATISYGHRHKSVVMLTEAGAKKLQTKIETRLLRAKKLLLALDLDATVVHATNANRHDKSAEFFSLFSHSRIQQQATTRDSPKAAPAKSLEQSLHLIELGDGRFRSSHYVKVRPGVQYFFDTLKDHYEFHVFTHGYVI